MKAYTVVTGVVFAAITIAHIARIFAEGTQLLTAAPFMLLTALAAGICVWSATIFRRLTAKACAWRP